MTKHKRILILEDNEICSIFLSQALQRLGNFETVCVHRGEDAVQAVQDSLKASNPFHLAFLDITLPGMDGLQTLESIRAAEREAEIPENAGLQALMVTAMDDDTTATRAFIRGNALCYITKPISEERIREELTTLGLLD